MYTQLLTFTCTTLVWTQFGNILMGGPYPCLKKGNGQDKTRQIYNECMR